MGQHWDGALTAAMQLATGELAAALLPGARGPVVGAAQRLFYITDVNARPARVDPDAWRLRIHGRVERPLELALGDLESLGLEELDATLVCVHNPVGGDRIGSARWIGVPLSRLLELAGVRPD